MTQKKHKNPMTVKNKAKGSGSPITKVMVESKALATFVAALEILKLEPRVHIAQDRLSVRSVDAANVGMLVGECECKAEIPEKGIDKFGLQVSMLKRMMLHSKDCRITLGVSDELCTIEYGRFSGKFPLIDNDSIRKDPNLPNINLDTSIEVPGKYLHDAVRIVSKDNGRIIFRAKNGVAFIDAEEGEISMTEVVGTCDKESEARSIFSNDHILPIASLLKTAQCNLKIGTDNPIHINAELNGCKFDFYIAPRIEAD